MSVTSHEHALGLAGGRGVGRGRHLHAGRVDRSAREDIGSPVRCGELDVRGLAGAFRFRSGS